MQVEAFRVRVSLDLQFPRPNEDGPLDRVVEQGFPESLANKGGSTQSWSRFSRGGAPISA